jgi:methylenetetrahydrofolate--tRNA-(uracil-5-)-methyltransferase
VVVVGGGLAGCEAAWALAEHGVAVSLHEMRPARRTAAHQTDRLAELVCSNTFKSVEPTNAHGLLKAEMRRLGSLVLRAADATRVPGGAALAVDRVAFAEEVQRRILSHPLITVVRGEVTDLPAPGVVATGPLTSEALSAAIARRLGTQALAFFDAIAPIVATESLDVSPLFRASRYGKGGGEDYLNAPFTAEEYDAFVTALIAGDQYQPSHEFDRIPYFEGCLPVEEMARRGHDTLRFGPMKPVGLRDPRSGREPYAVVQLRQEDRAGQMWNLVGFQTRLRTAEQQRVFRTIPGLAHAEFLRYGSVHRNSYINAPAALTPHLSARDDPTVLFAGQLTGVEGYTESAATGLQAGINLARLLAGERPRLPPPTTMLGALYRYLQEADPARFQPMNANFGLLEALVPPVKDKGKKKELLAARAMADIETFAAGLGMPVAA